MHQLIDHATFISLDTYENAQYCLRCCRLVQFQNLYYCTYTILESFDDVCVYRLMLELEVC